MPGFDGSGPMGSGSMTGGARGNCNPASAGCPTDGYFGFGRGMAYGRGFARGAAMYPQMYNENPADELILLKQQADVIKNTMDSINQRIVELEKKE